MSDTSWDAPLRQTTRVVQIIVGALAAGSLAFLVVVVVLSQYGVLGPPPGSMLISFMALAMLVPVLIARLVVPSAIVRQLRQKLVRGAVQSLSESKAARMERRRQSASLIDPQELLNAYQARTIVAGALLEGVTFFLLIAHLLERSPWTLAAAAVLIVAILLHMPTYGRLSAWLDQQRQLAANEIEMVSV